MPSVGYITVNETYPWNLNHQLTVLCITGKFPGQSLLQIDLYCKQIQINR